MTTVRQIRPLNMRGIDAAAIASAKPRFDWVDPQTLFVEESYQRGLAENSVTLIRKIVGRWNWAHIKPPVCVRDSKGRLIVLDGQHTAIAAASHGNIPKIPVMIVEADSVKARATAFISQNRDRIILTPMHMHFAALAAGDEIAVAVDEACRKSKVTILKASRGTTGIYRVGETFAVGVITRLVKQHGVNATARVLRVLVDAKRAPVPAHEISAVAQLLFAPEHKGQVEAFDIATVIRAKTVDHWKARASKAVEAGAKRSAALASVLKKAARDA